MFGDGGGNSDQSKEQAFNTITGQRFSQFLIRFVAEVNARGVAKTITVSRLSEHLI